MNPNEKIYLLTDFEFKEALIRAGLYGAINVKPPEPLKLPTDHEIALHARSLYPYLDEDTESRQHKKASQRRNFIRGVKWLRDQILKQIK